VGWRFAQRTPFQAEPREVVRQFVNVEIVVTPETRDVVRVDIAGRALP
jgi:hypothetical protein